MRNAHRLHPEQMPHSKTDRQAEPETVHMRTLTRSHSFTRVPFRSRCRLQDAVNNMRAKLKKQELQIQSENISLTEVGVYKEAKHTNTNARTQTQTQAQTQTHTHKHTHTNTNTNTRPCNAFNRLQEYTRVTSQFQDLQRKAKHFDRLNQKRCDQAQLFSF